MRSGRGLDRKLTRCGDSWRDSWDSWGRGGWTCRYLSLIGHFAAISAILVQTGPGADLRGKLLVGKVRKLLVGTVRKLLVGAVRKLLVGTVRKLLVGTVRKLLVGTVGHGTSTVTEEHSEAGAQSQRRRVRIRE